MTFNKKTTVALSFIAAITAAGTALAAPPALPKDGSWGPGAGNANFDAMMQSGFQTKGIANV